MLAFATLQDRPRCGLVLKLNISHGADGQVGSVRS